MELARHSGSYSGVIKIQIPVFIGFFGGEEATIHLHVPVIDALSLEERLQHRFPADLPCANNWPFNHRLLVRNRVPRLVERFLGIMLDEGSIRFAIDRSTVELEIYALQGVGVTASIGLAPDGHEDFEPFSQDIGQLTLKITVIRLADQTQVPENGTPIGRDQVLPSFPVEPQPIRGVPPAAMCFDVEHKTDGIAVTWLPTRQILTLTHTDLTDQSQGFALYFNPAPNVTGSGAYLRYADLLHVLITDGIEVSVSAPLRPDDGVDVPAHVAALIDQSANNYEGNFDGEKKGVYTREFIDPFAMDAWLHDYGEPKGKYPGLPMRDIAESRFFSIEKVSSIRQLPPWDAPFRVTKDIGDRHYDAWRELPESTGEMLAKTAIDVGLGFVPFVGDAADFAEFNAAMATGTDRWGRPVARWEVALMGISVIPLIGSVAGIARFGGRLVRALKSL